MLVTTTGLVGGAGRELGGTTDPAEVAVRLERGTVTTEVETAGTLVGGATDGADPEELPPPLLARAYATASKTPWGILAALRSCEKVPRPS